MGFLRDKIGNGGGAAGGVAITGSVNTFADLPSAATHPGQYWIVNTSTGLWIINRKEKGIYRSNGTIWERLGNWVEAFDSANFEIYDTTTTNKAIGFNASGITAGNKRILTVPDDNGTLLLTTGLAGGQIITGGKNANDNIIYKTTTNVTKGYHLFQEGRVGIGSAFSNPMGILHVQFSTAAEQPYFERLTAQTNFVASTCVYKAKSSSNMLDDFGPALFMAIEDVTPGENIIGAFAFTRESSDNSGKFIVAPYSAGSPIIQIEVMPDGGLFVNNLLGAAIAGNPPVYYNTTSKEIFYDSSSSFYKKNIRELIDNDTSWLYNLHIIKADRKDESIMNEICMIAEEVEQVNSDYIFKIARNNFDIQKAKSINKFDYLENVEVPEANIQTEGICYIGMIPAIIQELKKIKLIEIADIVNRLDILENR